MSKHALALILIGLAIPAWAEQIVVIDVGGAAPGRHFIEVTIDAKGEVSGIRKLTNVVRLGGNPAPTPPPPPTPDPPPTDPLREQIRKLTLDTNAKGGTRTTAAALAAIYEMVADGVSKWPAAGSIPPANAIPAVKAATDAVMATQADRNAWQPWRTSVGGALDKLRQDGSLSTKEDYVYAFTQIAAGIKEGTNTRSVDAQKLLTQGESGVSAHMREAVFGDINFAQLLELIKLIVELLKLFGIGGPR